MTPASPTRLAFRGARDSSMIGKMGPRDYCGFEMDAAGHFDSPGFEGVRDRRRRSRRPARVFTANSAPATLDEPTGQRPDGRRAGHLPPKQCRWNEPKGPPPISGAKWARQTVRTSGLFSRLRPPEVPGYEILGELGRGGMGVVYKARQRRLNRVVALKMILAGDYAGPDAVERIMAEAEIVARLQHPNIVQIYAIGDCDGRPYVELEYVGGGSLADRLDGTPWPPRAAARLVESLAVAMAEAHRMGIIHRDLKPANILMTDDGTPEDHRLRAGQVDREATSGLTRTESILGSPRYMAPEQAEGHTREVGPAADVYALGTNLYELLTGRPPFVAPTVLATLDLVKNAEPVAPRRLQPGLASDLETICLKCLRKEAAERYESADALAEDLTRYLNGEPILARPTSSWERGVEVGPPPPVSRCPGCRQHAVDSRGGRRRAVVPRRPEPPARDWPTAASRRSGPRFAQFVVLGEEAIRREDWDSARTQLSSALALARTELRLAAMRDAVTKMLALTDPKIAERTSRDAARARFSAFQRYYDEAVFYQSQYTGLEPEANLRASRAAARRALEQFEPNEGTGAGLALAPAHFDPAEVGAITDALLRAGADPRRGHLPTAARRGRVVAGARAHCRSSTGSSGFVRRRPCSTAAAPPISNKRATWIGAEAERRLAETMAEADHSSVDDFLEGEAAYHSRDYKQAVQAFRRVLGPRARPFLGPVPAGDLPPQGAPAVRGPGRADRMPEPAARLRLDVSPQGFRRRGNARVRPGRRRLRAGDGAWSRRGGALRHAGQPRRDASPPGATRGRDRRLPGRDRLEARPVPGVHRSRAGVPEPRAA